MVLHDGGTRQKNHAEIIKSKSSAMVLETVGRKHVLKFTMSDRTARMTSMHYYNAKTV
jgi:hypothetical protein